MIITNNEARAFAIYARAIAIYIIAETNCSNIEKSYL